MQSCLKDISASGSNQQMDDPRNEAVRRAIHDSARVKTKLFGDSLRIVCQNVHVGALFNEGSC
jgi:hypothetical protein